jgi:hypothetical protein
MESLLIYESTCIRFICYFVTEKLYKVFYFPWQARSPPTFVLWPAGIANKSNEMIHTTGGSINEALSGICIGAIKEILCIVSSSSWHWIDPRNKHVGIGNMAGSLQEQN